MSSLRNSYFRARRVNVKTCTCSEGLKSSKIVQMLCHLGVWAGSGTVSAGCMLKERSFQQPLMYG